MNGYFLKGFADQLTTGGLMGDRRDKLARERFEYLKNRDKLADASSLKKLQQQKELDDIKYKKGLLEVAALEEQNVDRQGSENFLRNVIRKPNADQWYNKYLEGKGEKELGLMAGTLAANEQSKYLGGDGAFKMPVDPTILTTQARLADNRANRAFKGSKGTNLTGDIKEYYDMTGVMPKTWDDIKRMKTASRPDPQLTESERYNKKLRDSYDKLDASSRKDPNKFFEDNSIRMNDDGSIYRDPVTNTPVKLKSFEQVTGKRGMAKAIIGVGEQWDDAKELMELLALPSVQTDFKKAKEAGMWDRTKGSWGNKIKKWKQSNGIASDSPTATAISRMQRMASDIRKTYMGTAVTEPELRSALAWMPDAGDNYDTMINKTRLMAQESRQMFDRFLDIYSKNADMSTFYKAFGIKRFKEDDLMKEINKLMEE